MRLLRLLLALVFLSIAFVGNRPASAVEQGTLGPIGPKKTTVKKTFGPIVGQYADPAVNVFAEYRPPTCAKVTYCDAFEVSVNYPKSFEKSVFFGMTVTLDWPNPRTKKNATGNDLDMFLWGDNGPAAGGPASKCSSPNDAKCDNLTSETVNITEPDDSTRAKAPMYFTVVNGGGVNTGYTITVTWYTFDLPPPPNFTRPEIGVSKQNVSGPFPSNVTPSKEAPSGVNGPEPTPRKILVPGPDGKMHEIELPSYAAGAKLTANSSKPRSPWLPAFIAGAIVLIALSTYLVIRARRQDAAT